MTGTVTTTPTTSASPTSSAATNPLGDLSGNLSNFLSLLMTQLQHQDPTAPMDSSQFTSQLVQYSSVEQQINMNTNLTSLIQATQSNTILQSSALIGKQVDVTSSQLPLQNGSASASFTAPQAEPVSITVTNASGVAVLQTAVSAQSGSNTWAWNGKDSHGNQLPDGAYSVSVADATENSLATTVTGTVTGLQRSGTTLNVALGGLTTNVNNIQSVGTSQ